MAFLRTFSEELCTSYYVEDYNTTLDPTYQVNLIGKKFLHGGHTHNKKSRITYIRQEEG